uniref:Thioredoxin domain-containing protein n=2 Tax=Rhinopithecus TaxID=542827 RepID=A0A2K6M5C9_RHIBE
MAPSRSLVVPLAVLVLLLWGQSNIRIITDENWTELLEGGWMTEFYAPWCPACQNLQPFAEWGEYLRLML